MSKHQFWLNVQEIRYSKNVNDLTTLEIVKLVKKKKTAPKGRIRDFYGCKDNSDVAKLIFKSFMQKALEHIVEGGVFSLPLYSAPNIYVGQMDDVSVKKARQSGKYKFINMRATGYKIFLPKFSFGPQSHRREMDIVLPKSLFKQLIKNQNAGMAFTKIPRMQYVKKYGGASK